MVRAIVALVCLIGAAVVPASTLLAQETPLEINAILSTTGPAAFLGAHEARTLGIVERFVNNNGGIGGRPIKFVVQDDGGNLQTTIQIMNVLMAKKVNVVLGPGITAMCGAVVPLLSNGPVSYCLSPGIQPPQGSYMFTANVGSLDYMGELIRFFKLRGWTRIALLTSLDATGRDTDHSFEVGLGDPTAAPVRMVAQEHFANQDISVAGQLTRIKAANPQVLIAWTAGTQFGTVLRNIVDAGITIPIVASSANLSHEQLGQYRSFAPKLFFMSGGGAAVQPGRGKVRDAQLTFSKAFRDAGLRSEYLDTIAWDPSFLLIEALRRVGTSATPEALRAYLAGLHDWSGIVGTYDFRKYPQRGLGRNAATMYQWDPANDEISVLPIR